MPRPLGDPLEELGPRPVQPDIQHAQPGVRLLPLRIEAGGGRPGQVPDLQRAHDAADVVGMQPVRRDLIDLGEAGVKRRGPLQRGAFLVVAPHLRVVGKGDVHGGVKQRIIVEGRPPDEQRDPAAGAYPTHGAESQRDEIRHGEHLGSIVQTRIPTTQSNILHPSRRIDPMPTATNPTKR